MNAESYLTLFFLGFLGLFNSASLEMRQLTDSNAELLFQNGMIISTTLMVVSIAGSIGETIAYVRYKNIYGNLWEKEIILVKPKHQRMDLDKIKRIYKEI